MSINTFYIIFILILCEIQYNIRSRFSSFQQLWPNEPSINNSYFEKLLVQK